MKRISAVFSLMLFLGHPSHISAADPEWWTDEFNPIINPDAPTENLGIANLGQAKCVVLSALEALRLNAPMIAERVENDLIGPGKALSNIDPPESNEEHEQQYSPLLLGQLKSIAAPFYDHLHFAAPAWLANERSLNQMPDTGTFYPWTSVTTDDANFSPVVIGQLKAVFSLRFGTLASAMNPDLDGDGLTNQQEAELGTDPYIADSDGDGMSDYLENLLGNDPLSPEDDSVSGPPSPDDLAAAPPISRAAADGYGLPRGLSNSSLIGRWDFESLEETSNHPIGFGPLRFNDKTSNNRDAFCFGAGVNPDGMISNAASFPARNFATVSNKLLNGKTTYSVAFWASISQGSIPSGLGSGQPVNATGLFSHHRYLNTFSSNVSQYPTLNIDLNGIWLQKNNDKITVNVGSYVYSNIPPSIPKTIITGLKIDFPIGQLDNNQFHHFVMVRSSAKTILYINGEKMGETTHRIASIKPDLNAGVSIGRLYGPTPEARSPLSPGNPTALIGKVDRLRVWSRVIKPSEVTSLYNQDIDGDKLWDRTEIKTSIWRDTNGNAQNDNGEMKYQRDPFKWEDENTDTDDDGLTDIHEQNQGPNILNPDTDGDLMPDGWERKNGFDPTNSADGTQDADTDGVSNLDEYRHNTDPHKDDTDGDGKRDRQEINGPDGNPDTDDGSDPRDSGDGGSRRPADQLVTFNLGVGDRSGSHSEDYVMNVYRLNTTSGEENRVFTLRSGGYGQYKKTTKSFRKGDAYTFQIDWQGTNNNKRTATSTTSAEGPDFDYTFEVQPQGATGGILLDSYDPKTKSTGTPILADDANNVASDLSEFKKKYEDKRVALIPVDLNIVHPATGELAEDKEDGTSGSPDGGYISIKRTVGSDAIAMGGEDVAPVTKLSIKAIKGVSSTTKVRLKFNAADRYKIYKDELRTEEVTSEQTEFVGNQDTILYLQGLKKSLSRGGEQVTMQVKFNDAWVDGDSVKYTIVQSEFLIQIKAFIPYEWTEGESVWLINGLNPMNGKVAHGDDRNMAVQFKNAFSDKGSFYSVAPFRLCHEVILTPYPDLHYFFQDLVAERKLTSAPSSDHYTKTTSVDPSELALKNGYISLTPPSIATGPPVISPATYAPELLLYNLFRGNKCALYLTGSGKDGAMGIFTAASPAIDWNIRLEIDSSTNPLQPSIRVEGEHDLYPAYEIIVIQADGTFKDTHRHMPNRDVYPGPISLGSASITFDNTRIISN